MQKVSNCVSVQIIRSVFITEKNYYFPKFNQEYLFFISSIDYRLQSER